MGHEYSSAALERHRAKRGTGPQLRLAGNRYPDTGRANPYRYPRREIDVETGESTGAEHDFVRNPRTR
jgi:hypothetical protein